MEPVQNNSVRSHVRLKGFYYSTQLSGLAGLLLFGFAIYRYQDYFTIFHNIPLTLVSFAAIFVIHGLCFVFQEWTENKIFYVISRYSWVGFFLSVVYLSGATQSSLLFILVFPILVSAADLDVETVRRMAVLITLSLAGMILFDPIALSQSNLIMAHLFRLGLFAFIAYYIYKIVKETLRQKYEKEESKRKFAQLIELDRVKTDFITVAQHQMRTPLTAIRWGLDTALSEPDVEKNADLKSILTETAAAANKSMDILNQLLKTSEAEAGSINFQKKPLALLSLFKQITDDVSYVAKHKGVTVRISFTPDLSVNGDYNTLHAALLNVVDNAVRYSPRGSVDVSGKKIEGQQIAITVRDNGIGIDKDDLPHIFDRFYRGKNAISLEPSDTGVGLYITKKILELHTGTISLESSVGKGTTVTIVLPETKVLPDFKVK
ncbi:MAG: HAMP domain-containing sensor histidine kinase [Patescibacteria group bacterium]